MHVQSTAFHLWNDLSKIWWPAWSCLLEVSGIIKYHFRVLIQPCQICISTRFLLRCKNCYQLLHTVSVKMNELMQTCNWVALIGRFDDKMPPRLESRRCCCCCCWSWSTSTCGWRAAGAGAPGGKRTSTGAVLLRAAGSSELWLAISSAVMHSHITSLQSAQH